LQMIIILNIRLEVVILVVGEVDFVILKLEMSIILNVGLVLEKGFLFFLSLA